MLNPNLGLKRYNCCVQVPFEAQVDKSHRGNHQRGMVFLVPTHIANKRRANTPENRDIFGELLKPV